MLVKALLLFQQMICMKCENDNPSEGSSQKKADTIAGPHQYLSNNRAPQTYYQKIYFIEKTFVNDNNKFYFLSKTAQ